MKKYVTVLMVFSLIGCIPPHVVTSPTISTSIRPAVTVTASKDSLWDSVIDEFANDNIPIKSMEKVSGLIVGERSGISGQTFAQSLSDCGNVNGVPITATVMHYNIIVRGDKNNGTVRVTVRFVAAAGPQGIRDQLVTRSPGHGEVAPRTYYISHYEQTYSTVECVTRGVYESAFEQRVKQSAEKKAK